MVVEHVALGYSLVDLHMQINMLHHLQKSYLRPKAASLGLGPGQPRILSYLAVHGPSTQRDIAAHYRIDAAAVSRMVDSMAKNGFVELVAGDDRRTRVVRLTRAGRDALVSWDAACCAFDELALAGFSEEERATLDNLHNRLRRAIEAQLDGSVSKDGKAPHA